MLPVMLDGIPLDKAIDKGDYKPDNQEQCQKRKKKSEQPAYLLFSYIPIIMIAIFGKFRSGSRLSDKPKFVYTFYGTDGDFIKRGWFVQE
jgi:hypothetical protein